MLVDQDNKFLSQRTFPKMALLHTALADGLLCIYSEKLPVNALRIPLEPETFEEEISVEIWNDKVMAWRLSTEYDQWFSNTLHTDCRLVYMPAGSKRLVDPGFALNDDIVGFADSFPFLLIGEGSLQDLNRRLEVPVPMKRFRPNLVVSGSEPFAEDEWHIIKIGGSRFKVAKPCARCSVITIETQTATRTKEPLKTLQTYRVSGSKVMFGQNLLCLDGKQVKVGEKLDVLSFK